jgi:WhiB family redox-sensing transcriptional regulator
MVDEHADAEYATGTYAAECPDLSLLAHRPCWQRQASCRGAGTDLWFPVAAETVEVARAVCEACPVRRPCLEYAITSSRVLEGIWAGTAEEERAQMRQAPKSGA